VNGAPVEVAMASGVALLEWETATLDDALAALEDAMRRRRVATSDPARDTMVDGLRAAGNGAAEPAEDVRELEEVVAGILSGDDLVAVAQPIVRVSDEVVVGYEMLTRGREGLYEAPAELLRLARHRGLLTRVDLRCMQTCLEEAATLAPHLLISFNLFPTTLLDILLEDVINLFEESDARLCLELSEEQFVGDPRELGDRIAALRAAGVKLAIDDVGKGRGTLDSVMLLEPDIVKIDRELITGASRDTRKERLLRRLVALAATLGCEVVGEGVEKAEDLGLLRELEVPYAQGFLWSAPASLDSLPSEDTRVSSSPPAGA
jgi:EAL domain-containing protein (putative c-di-GMP-specific phosphodiesterase class I)